MSLPDSTLGNAAIGRLLIACALIGVAMPAAADTWIWVDEDGVTHLTDDPDAVPAAHRETEADQIDTLRGLWKDEVLGSETRTPPGASGGEGDRYLRLLGGAVDDLRRGETARAAATLRSVRRMWPARAEAYWYLAMLDRRRGRYEGASEHLMQFQERAGEDLAAWSEKADRLGRELRDERRLVEPDIARGPLRFTRVKTRNFRLDLDSELGRADRDYADTVLGFLEEAREEVSNRVGVTPLEPLGVVLYGKAAYLQAHRHRFSFQTVGFFDGRIHVTSPAHPSE
ncbi:MAG: DUF4124 domain-containing protein, partial [bacterium]|nr:DUF4124 domain-containing protein [bacterium]